MLAEREEFSPTFLNPFISGTSHCNTMEITSRHPDFRFHGDVCPTPLLNGVLFNTDDRREQRLAAPSVSERRANEKLAANKSGSVLGTRLPSLYSDGRRSVNNPLGRIVANSYKWLRTDHASDASVRDGRYTST